MQLQQKVLELMKKIPKGKITTYKIIASKNGGIKTKIKMLQQEGIQIQGNKIVDFEKVLHRF